MSTATRVVYTPLTEADIRDFPIESARGWFLLDNLRDQVRELAAGSLAYAFRADGVLVAMAGVYQAYPGVGEAWAVSTPVVEHFPRQFHRAALAAFREVRTARPMHRIHCFVDAEYAQGRRWATALGFQPEAYLRKIGPRQESLYVLAMFPEVS